MINVNAITVKNFMSVGNQTQAVQFNKSQLTLVLGQNLDLGGDDVGARDTSRRTPKNTSTSMTGFAEEETFEAMSSVRIHVKSI